MQQKYIKLDSILLSAFLVLSIGVFPTFALTRSQYDKYVSEGKLSGLTIEFSDAGQKYRKHGRFIIDDAYEGGDSENPYNNDGERNAGTKLVPGASGYKVYGEIDEDTIDYSYEEDEDLNSTEYARAEFEARLKAMEYGNSYAPSIGYGKYHLRPGKNLTAFIKFAYDFYKNESGEVRVGYKTPQELSDAGINVKDPCPMEFLETYANINYTDTTNCDTGLSQIWQNCTESWTYEGDKLENTDNIFEKLQDIFMAEVYLIPAIRKIKSIGKLKSTEELNIQDNAAILSMMYERFGGRPINPSKVESGAITKIGAGDIIAALVDIEDMTIAEKIYTYMIEVKYKNNEEKLAGWLKECEEVCGEYSMLDADQYNEYIKAYNEAYKKYGKDTSYDTLLDYGGVLTPDIFESKISYEKAIKKFKANLLKYFGGSSFMKQGGNPNYVAKSYAMARAMCENSNFSDITDIYACDMDVVEHTYGYDSNHIILLADTQVVTLEDVYGSDTDSDKDGMLDYVEAYNEEEVDITKFLEKYCDYNGYTDEEKEIMLTKNSKIKMYNYISNPVLPDSDFDGINDKDDMSKLNNEIHSINQTDNYEGIKITYAQDYRYFFMESDKYYEELGMMGLVLSNMASKKNNSDKTWIKENKNDREQAHGLIEYMAAIGNESIKDCTINKVPYAIGQKDVLALKGKHNNLERNVITIAIGESKEYKDILAANYDGQLGDDTGRDYHHIGYDHESDEICDALIEYDNEQNNTSWKKSYFIVGYGTGGAIANLVAKKFIDHKRSNKNIYCYTYQAPNTINRNNLTKRISNTKYQSIFNIENTDDIMLNLMGSSTGWTKYGVLKKESIGDNYKFRDSWNRLTNDNYKSGNFLLHRLFLGAFGLLKKLISFSYTYAPIDNLDSLELARAIYLHDLQKENPLVKNSIIKSYLSNPELMKPSEFLFNVGRVANKQSQDITTADQIVINELSIRLMTVINPLERDVNMTLCKALDHIGSWYVNNIFTYQGAEQTVKEIEDIVTSSASIQARTKWEEYKKDYTSKTGILIKGDSKIIEPADVGVKYAKYKSDKFERLGYEDIYVSDDCSKFAAAVYYHYFNRKNGETNGKGISLLFTGSSNFIFDENSIGVNDRKIGHILSQNGYKIYKFNDAILKDETFELKEGDLLYRPKKTKNAHNNTKDSGHVEFYINDMTSFGWGEVHKSYTENDLNKEFRIIRTEEDFKKYFGNDIPYKPGIYNTKHRGDGEQCANEKMCDAGCGYTHVIRYEGVN